MSHRTMLSEYENMDQERKIDEFSPFAPEIFVVVVVVNRLSFNMFKILILCVSVCVYACYLVGI